MATSLYVKLLKIAKNITAGFWLQCCQYYFKNLREIGKWNTVHLFLFMM
jgi:hypothetical protein